MSRSLTVNGVEFEVKDAGGGGDCFFKSLAFFLDERSHYNLRQKVVSRVINNWPEYSVDVAYNLHCRTVKQYQDLMSRSGVYASLVECRAAAAEFNINIRVVRFLENSDYFILPFEVGEKLKNINLLFTGMNNGRGLDGHFQVLLEKSCAENVNSSTSDDSDYNSFSEVCVERCGEENMFTAADSSTVSSQKDECCEALISSTEEEESREGHSVEKIPKIVSYGITEKVLIMNAREYFEEEKSAGQSNDINKVISRTSKCLKISESTVKRISKEWKTSGVLKTPHQKAGRPTIECDDFLQGVIRRKIHDFYGEKKFPTVEELHARLKKDVSDLPDFSASTLRNWMMKLNFSYTKLKKKPVWMESYKIAAQRAEYLRKVKDFRENGYNIFYSDETWCGKNHSKQFGWVEYLKERDFSNFDFYRERVQEIGGIRGGFLTPSGSGKRLIILHIGSKNGFLPGGSDCFIAKKDTNDYHNEMNAQHFEKWFRLILTLVPAKSIVVLDQAPYHTMLDPEFRNPVQSWKKEKIIDWMSKRKIPLPHDVTSFQDLTKPELYSLCRPYHYPKKYLLETVAKEVRGDEVKILWLPVAHCEFNPIELIWAYVKNFIARNNSTFKIEDAQELCNDAIKTVDATLWQKCIQHAEKEEERYRITEGRIQVNIEDIIIQLGEEDTESESDEYFSEESDDNVQN